MRTIQINRGKPIYTEKNLDIKSMVEDEHGVLTVTTTKDCGLVNGDKIIFKRYALSEDSDNFVLIRSYSAKIFKMVSDTTFKIEAPQREPIYISGFTQYNGKIYRLRFNKPCDAFAQDIVSCGGNFSISITDSSKITKGTNLGISERYSPTHPKEEPVEPADFLMRKKYVEEYRDCPDAKSGIQDDEKEKYYIPNRLLRDSIYATVDNPDVLNYGMATFSQNEFYYKDNNGNCTTWDKMNQNYQEGIIVTISKEIGYWQASLGLSSNVDDVHLNQETEVNENFVENFKSKVIPDFIDMEKVRYKPVVMSDDKGSYTDVSALTFNLHFRKREGDSWSYTDDEEIWNTIDDFTNITLDNTAVTTSDLVSDLGFTDNDVRYRKLKVNKSFLRLAFYNSNDPLNQSLLYYSTIFMDGGSLYGKYMKDRTDLIEGKDEWDEEKEPQHVLKASGDYGELLERIDTQFEVHNEFDTERSSEGFYLYLFGDDAPEMGGEKLSDYCGKTIYMKVEFNHAGYGRTLPMIMWPYNGEPKDLTIENYRDNLYIPIKIMHINHKYCYTIDAKKIGETPCVTMEKNRIVLNLFEPKITKVTEKNGDN